MVDEMEKNIRFIKDDEMSEDDYLWKYLDLHKFLSLIFSESIHLTRLDKFEDKREGISLNHLLFKKFKKETDDNEVFNTIRELMTVDNFGSEMNKIDDDIKKVQRFNYASCWVIGKKHTESVAMWNLYSDPKSLAIRIKYSDFKNKILENSFKTDGCIKELICSPI